MGIFIASVAGGAADAHMTFVNFRCIIISERGMRRAKSH